VEGAQQFIASARAALGKVAADDHLRLETINVYLGPNPLFDGPTIAFRIWSRDLPHPAAKLAKLVEAYLGMELGPITCAGDPTPSEVAAAVAAAGAAALLSREVGIRTGWVVRPRRDGTAEGCVEFLLGAPAGAAFVSALMALAHQAWESEGAGEAVERQVSILRDQCVNNRPDKMTCYLIDAARANDIPFHSLGRNKKIWQFGWGSRSATFLGSASNEDGLVGFNIAKQKLNAKHLLRELGLPTPAWSALPQDGDPARAVSTVGWPCTVKPVDSSSGEGVSTNIKTMSQLNAAISLARGNPPRKLMIERHEPGSDHRLMVIDGNLFAAVRLDPPMVTGDGRSTVGQLIARLNETRVGGLEEAGFLCPVNTDKELLFRLQSAGLHLDSVIPEGETVVLRSAANRSAGGSATDVTAQVHPKVRQWAEWIAVTVGLRVTGIDYMCEDISRDPSEIGGGFIEINATPGLQVLSAAGHDRLRIGSALLGSTPGRIPVDFLLTDRVDEALAGLDREAGHAIAHPTGAEIGGTAIDTKQLSPFEIVGAVLRYKPVSRCTIVWTFDDMCPLGMPIDRIRRTSIMGSQPPEEWRALLGRISEEVVVARRSRKPGGRAGSFPAAPRPQSRGKLS
jgi:D-alanine-D-alanine ligase-like ATP-grasp enzyme